MRKRDHPFSVLFVCTGNICRSPMAEGLLRQMFAIDGIDEVEISSAGTVAFDGEFASKHALQAAAEYGIDLSTHRACRLAKKMLRRADLILAMSEEHVDYARTLVSRSAGKLFKLKGYPGNDENADSIVDPMGGNLDTYRRVFAEIKIEVERIYPKLREMAIKARGMT